MEQSPVNVDHSFDEVSWSRRFVTLQADGWDRQSAVEGSGSHYLNISMNLKNLQTPWLNLCELAASKFSDFYWHLMKSLSFVVLSREKNRGSIYFLKLGMFGNQAFEYMWKGGIVVWHIVIPHPVWGLGAENTVCWTKPSCAKSYGKSKVMWTGHFNRPTFSIA